MARGGLASVVCLTLAATCGCSRAPSGPPVRTRPAYPALSPYVSLPPAFEDRLLYYSGFEQPDGEPEVCVAGIERQGKAEPVAEGFRGRGARTGKQAWLGLRSADFSPHLPLTVSFWWALAEDHRVDGAFGLVHLGGGRGFVSHFSRGKGEWCALQRPAAILQVYYLPGIRNVNGIYDFDLMAHLDLRSGVWHHTALVFRGASLVEVYTDGQKAWETRLRGRPFRESDGLRDLVVGTRGGEPMLLDEVILLRRALALEEISDYVEALRQMRAVGYPAE